MSDKLLEEKKIKIKRPPPTTTLTHHHNHHSKKFFTISSGYKKLISRISKVLDKKPNNFKIKLMS